MGVVLRHQDEVLEGQTFLFDVGHDTSAGVAELGDSAELEERAVQDHLESPGDHRLAGAGRAGRAGDDDDRGACCAAHRPRLGCLP